MPINEIGAALATSNQVLEVTAAIVAAHLRGTETKAAHVPDIIRQVYDALTELVEGSGAEQAPRTVADAAPRQEIAGPPAAAALPWRETTALRGMRAGTRIGETPRERFRSRSR